VAAAAGQVAQVLVRGEAAVDDPHPTAQPPAAQVVLELGDHGLVVGVPRPHPDPDRDPLSGDGEPDHDLGQVGPVILGVAERAKRRVVRLVLGAVGLRFEVGRGGVEEEQVDLEVQEVGAGEEDRLLHLRLGVPVDEQIERPVGLIVVHRFQPRDRDVLGGPLGRRQLRARRQRPAADEREQHPLDVGREPARPQQLA
jgi:hypothetical protein